MFTIKLILLLIILSGLIAFVGDIVGRNLGRRRVSLLGLRPRTTARIVTVLTGIFITSLTLSFILLISENARIAVFSLESLKNSYQQINEKIKQSMQALQNLSEKYKSAEKEAAAAKGEIIKLEETKKKLFKETKELKNILDKLASEVQSAREGKLIFRINEPIITSIIKKKAPPTAIKEKLENILIEADKLLKEKEIFSPLKNKRAVWLAKQEFDEAIEFLKTHGHEDMIVRLICAQNTIAGEPVLAHFELFKNELVFKKNEILAQKKIEKKISKNKAEAEIQNTLNEINLLAQNRGVLTNAYGKVGNIPYELIYKTAENISMKEPPFNLKFICAEDTYTVGPLEIMIEME